MRRSMLLCAVAGAALLLVGDASATTRDIATLSEVTPMLRGSVLNELSGGLFLDPYDELRERPFNLPFAHLGRGRNLSPWPGQRQEQGRYLNALIGNNGNTNVRNESDVIQGAYVRQHTETLAWGVSASYLMDDRGDTNVIGTSTFGGGDSINGFDVRVGVGRIMSERFTIGGGIHLFDRSDEATDSSFEQGVGGFFSSQSVDQGGFKLDAGVRAFSGNGSSWEAQIVLGQGDTTLRDFSETLDDTRAVTSRFVVSNYDIGDDYLDILGGYNKRYASNEGEMQIRAGYRTADHGLSNSDLSFSESGGAVTPTLTLTGEDPVSSTDLFASFGSVNLYGPTEIFTGARLSLTELSGSTTVDSAGTVVDEAIDDSFTRLGVTFGLRQPLRSERLRLIASAHADYLDEDRRTLIDTSSSGVSGTQTLTRYTIGIEGVFSNITFDIAWLFGDDVSVGARQVIDADRLVVSATLAR